MEINITKDYVVTKTTPDRRGERRFIVLKKLPPQDFMDGDNSWQIIYYKDDEKIGTSNPDIWVWPNETALECIRFFHVEYDTEEEALAAFNLLRSME